MSKPTGSLNFDDLRKATPNNASINRPNTDHVVSRCGEIAGNDIIGGARAVSSNIHHSRITLVGIIDEERNRIPSKATEISRNRFDRQTSLAITNRSGISDHWVPSALL